MKTKKTTALFDLDGVLINSEQLIKAAFEHVFTTFKVIDTRVQERAGLNGYSLQDVYGLIAEGALLQSMKRAHADFQIKNMHLLQAVEDAILTLRELKSRRIQIGIVTNRTINAEHIIKYCGFREFVNLIVSADDVKRTKPHPEGIRLALDHFKARPEEAIMVGDMAADIEAGRGAGVTTVGVGTSVDLSGLKTSKPDYMIESLTDLIPWFFEN